MDRRIEFHQRVLRIAVRLALIGGLAFSGAACGLFDTRTPNKPGGGIAYTCLTLTVADNPYLEIARSYGRGAGLDCYIGALDTGGFAFHADPSDSITDPPKYQNWDKNVEDAVSRALISKVTSFSLTFTLDPNYVPTDLPDVKVRRYKYEIQTSGGSTADTLFQGFAEITVRLSGGLWHVTDWVDRQDTGGTTLRTWGYLRAAYRT